MAETRSERITRRYRAIVQRTYDPELARRAKHWSDRRILLELGIRVPKQMPKKRPIPRASTRERRRLKRAAELRREKFQFALSRGLPTHRALQLRNVSWAEVRRQVRRWPPPPPPPPDDWRRRYEEWKEWSSPKPGKADFPRWIKKRAEQLNEHQGFDKNGRWGYHIMYQVYVNRVREREALRRWPPILNEQDIYERIAGGIG